MLGDFNVENYIGYVRFALLVAYVIIVTILLLNLLIAMMGDTFGNVIESATQIWFVAFLSPCIFSQLVFF